MKNVIITALVTITLMLVVAFPVAAHYPEIESILNELFDRVSVLESRQGDLQYHRVERLEVRDNERHCLKVEGGLHFLTLETNGSLINGLKFYPEGYDRDGPGVSVDVQSGWGIHTVYLNDITVCLNSNSIIPYDRSGIVIDVYEVHR